MNQLNDMIVELGDDAMKSIVGGTGSCIDPLGGEGTGDGGGNGDTGPCIDPNG
jgi:hypothetical protein